MTPDTWNHLPDDAKAHIDARDRECERLRREIEKEKREVSAQELVTFRWQEECDRLKAVLDAEKRAHAITKRQSERAIDAQRSRADALATTYRDFEERAKAAYAELERKIEEQRAANRELKKSANECGATHIREANWREDLRRERDALRTSHDTLKAENERLTKERDAAKADRDKHERMLRFVGKHVATPEEVEEMVTMREQRDAALARLKSAEEALSTIRDELKIGAEAVDKGTIVYGKTAAAFMRKMIETRFAAIAPAAPVKRYCRCGIPGEPCSEFQATGACCKDEVKREEARCGAWPGGLEAPCALAAGHDKHATSPEMIEYVRECKHGDAARLCNECKDHPAPPKVTAADFAILKEAEKRIDARAREAEELRNELGLEHPAPTELFSGSATAVNTAQAFSVRHFPAAPAMQGEPPPMTDPLTVNDAIDLLKLSKPVADQLKSIAAEFVVARQQLEASLAKCAQERDTALEAAAKRGEELAAERRASESFSTRAKDYFRERNEQRNRAERAEQELEQANKDCNAATVELERCRQMLGLDLNERVSVGVYDLTKKVATLESNTAFMSQHLLAAEAKAEEARLLIVANAARIEFLKGIFVEAREDASVPYWLQVKIAEALK